MIYPWLSLLIVIALCGMGATLTYAEGVKFKPWYPWAMACLSVCGGLTYGFAVRYCRTPGETFALSVAWDVVAAVVYVTVPALAFGLRLPAIGWLGLILGAAGVVLLKVGTAK